MTPVDSLPCVCGHAKAEHRGKAQRGGCDHRDCWGESSCYRYKADKPPTTRQMVGLVYALAAFGKALDASASPRERADLNSSTDLPHPQ